MVGDQQWILGPGQEFLVKKVYRQYYEERDRKDQTIVGEDEQAEEAAAAQPYKRRGTAAKPTFDIQDDIRKGKWKVNQNIYGVDRRGIVPFLVIELEKRPISARLFKERFTKGLEQLTKTDWDDNYTQITEDDAKVGWKKSIQAMFSEFMVRSEAEDPDSIDLKELGKLSCLAYTRATNLFGELNWYLRDRNPRLEPLFYYVTAASYFVRNCGGDDPGTDAADDYRIDPSMF